VRQLRLTKPKIANVRSCLVKREAIEAGTGDDLARGRQTRGGASAYVKNGCPVARSIWLLKSATALADDGVVSLKGIFRSYAKLVLEHLAAE